MALLDSDRELTRDSYYDATAPRPASAPPLLTSADCDVAVVGGGLAGLSAALELAQRGMQVRLLEARRVGFGASGRNGGQAIHGLACDMSVIETQLGLDDARRVFDMTLQALDLLRARIAQHSIDCEWQDGYLGAATSARKAKALFDWADRMASVYGFDLQRLDRNEVQQRIASPRFHGAVHDPRSGHLHPLKYTLGLAAAAVNAGVQLHENCTVTKIQPAPGGTTSILETAITEPVAADGPASPVAAGRLRARHVLLAGNVYLRGLAPQLQARIMPVGTYIATTQRLDPALAARLIRCRSAVCDTNFVLDYFRTTRDDRMLYGGRVSYSTVTPARLAQAMRSRMIATFPQLASARIEHTWGGFVDITMNRAPDFGRLATGSPGASRSAPGTSVYYLQGFSGHGLALSGLAGQLVARAIAGDASGFDLMSRIKHRPFPGGPWLRTPALVLGMAWYRLRDALG